MFFVTVALAARLCLQPFSRLRDGTHDEGEALLRGIQHRAGTEACSGDHRIGGVLHGQFSTGRNFTNCFNTSLRSKRVLTACGVKVSFSLRCSKVTLQMLQYVRQKFSWLGILVCGFTNFPLGLISVLRFYGNMLFGLDLAAGKFFSLHFDILSVRSHTLLDSDWLLDV